MRILLSNDDGILAPGLLALYKAVRDLGEVEVVAPSTVQSAAGHAITIHDPLHVQRVHVGGREGFEGRSVTGSPADCVRLAISNLLDEAPDLVLSGINAGANVGNHVFYSGTVAAAAEGAMFNIAAVALSASAEVEPIDFERAAGYCRTILDRLLGRPPAAGDLVNVNLPPLVDGAPRGVRVVRQSKTEMRDVYLKVDEHNDRQEYHITDYAFAPEQEDTDVVLLQRGYITVTPLQIDMTRHDELARYAEADWDDVVE